MSKMTGKGFTAEIKGKKLMIEVDLDANQGLSGSGKNIIVATTSGNLDLENGMKMGLNVFKKPETK